MIRFFKTWIRTLLLVAFIMIFNYCLFSRFLDISVVEIELTLAVTLITILCVSLLFSFGEMLIHYYGITIPVRRIKDGIDRFMEGKFDAKIETFQTKKHGNEFDEIIRGLNHMSEELSSVETLRTDFISNVSHEMKTPLAVIQNYSTLLQAPNLPEEKRLEYTKAIMVQTKKMSHTISNILRLSKLENQQFHPNNSTYNLGEQLCECMLIYEEVWEEKNMTIETNIEENVMVCLDEELMSQVWINLISNAVKFTEKGDKIRLVLRTEEDKAVVVLRDSGCGMDKETMKHIFSKFYQGDTSHATSGNGLGLPLVKSILNTCGGEIQVNSQPGVGSAFTVILDRIE